MKISERRDRAAQYLAEYRQSDLSRSEFAAKAGVSYATLCWWLRREQAERDGKPSKGEVRRTRPPKKRSSFVPVVRSSDAGGTMERVTVRLGNQELDVPAGFPAEDLRVIVSVLLKAGAEC